MRSLSIWRHRLAVLLVFSAASLSGAASQAGSDTQDARRALVFYPEPIALPSGINSNHDRTFAGLGTGMSAPATAADELRKIDSYQSSIRAIEQDQGSFAPELFQELLALGKAQHGAGRYDAALETLQRAAHISRIHEGLYSADQIALTEAIVDSLVASGRHEDVEQQLERLVSLNRKIHGANQPSTALAMHDLGDWKLRSYIGSLQGDPEAYLVETWNQVDLHTRYELYSTSLEDLYDAQDTFLGAIRTLVRSDAFDDPELLELENKLLLTYYLNANRQWMLQGDGEIWQGEKTRHTAIRTGAEQNLSPEDYRHGLDSYRRQLGYLRNNPAVTYGQLADTMLAMADWHQLFGKFALAREQQAKLEGMLERAGLEADQISQLMRTDEAVVLPVFMQTPLSARPFDAEAMQGHIDVLITRNRSGRVIDAEVLGTSARVSDDIQDHLLSLVRNTRFRLAADNGGQSAMRYHFE